MPKFSSRIGNWWSATKEWFAFIGVPLVLLFLSIVIIRLAWSLF